MKPKFTCSIPLIAATLLAGCTPGYQQPNGPVADTIIHGGSMLTMARTTPDDGLVK